jgi:hypothetical protein
VGEGGIVVRVAALIEEDVDGELVALDVKQGKCFGFNGTATVIWRTLAEPRSMADICLRLTREFEVDPETCRAQVETLVVDMAKRGLVKVEPLAS